MVLALISLDFSYLEKGQRNKEKTEKYNFWYLLPEHTVGSCCQLLGLDEPGGFGFIFVMTRYRGRV